MIGLLLIASHILENSGIGFVDSLGCKPNNEKLTSNELGFSWSTCGSSGESVQVKSLSILPDPVIIPGSVFMETGFSVNTTLKSPLPLSIEVKKKVVFVWIPIPCEDGIGSCSYDDVCQLIKKFQCPQAFKKYGIPCECPLPNGVFNLPISEVIEIDKSILPSWLESGHYKVSGSLLNNKGNEVLCIDTSITVGTKSQSLHIIDNYI